MTTDEIKTKILSNQYLLQKADKMTITKNLYGFQAHYLSNAFHAMRIRCSVDYESDDGGDGLAKTWALRGTMHVIIGDDVPLNYRVFDLFTEFLYSWGFEIDAARNRMFAEHILHLIGDGVCGREELKAACYQIGMTDKECTHVFNPWGGTIRALAEEGKRIYKVQEKKSLHYALRVIKWIKHPCDHGSGFPYVMTSDFLITTLKGFVARTLKIPYTRYLFIYIRQIALSRLRKEQKKPSIGKLMITVAD